ncbi:MAG: phosphotransferase [Rhodobiaceae bacterium]|nr:phosphotransferase [Rhodobiaceae bacterium]
MSDALTRIRGLSIWKGTPEIAPLEGGITNTNFKVLDETGAYVVRIGDDIPAHQVMRFNELAASKAAQATGISPGVVHAEKGLLVLEFIDGRTFGPDDVRDLANLRRIVTLMKCCHRDMPRHMRGPALVFWVFHVIRDYAATLKDSGSSHLAGLHGLLAAATALEAAAGPFDIVFGHNDLLAANILDDGERLWLVDWDYAGFNSPLFDLGGLASNNEFSEEQERWLLETYFWEPVTDERWRRYQAMKCASLLRETMWSMVSEIHSTLDFDYAAYTAENLARFDAALADFKNT